MKWWNYFTDGIWKNNPILVLMIGLCPTLAVSSSAFNSLGMGLAVIFVLTLSNLTVSILKPVIPENIRIPIFIVVISTFVTIIDYTMHAYLPSLYSALGIFVPLIVVNCVILGRAEGFAYRNSVWKSVLDGLGSGIGFTIAITILGSIREILGNGTIFGFPVFGSVYASQPALMFILPPGAFIVIAFMMAAMRSMEKKEA